MKINKENIQAVIDVGTNNILLLIAQKDLKNDRINIIHRDSVVSALGKDMKKGFLTESAIIRSKDILKKLIIKSKNYTEEIYVIGTSCSREAKNINEISNWLSNNFDLKYQIISGDREAELNGLANLREFNSINNFILFDIGGGSTEFTYINSGKIHKKISIKLGIRRLINTFDKDIRDQLVEIKSQLNNLVDIFPSNVQLIGLGGTVTSLAAINQNLFEYRSEYIHKSRLKNNQLIDIISKIETLNEEDIARILPFEPGRADILLTGTLIVKEILSFFKAEDFLISDRGLQFGYLYSEDARQSV